MHQHRCKPFPLGPVCMTAFKTGGGGGLGEGAAPAPPPFRRRRRGFHWGDERVSPRVFPPHSQGRTY